MAYLGRATSIGSFKKVDSIAALQNNTRTIFPLTITSELNSYELKPVSPFALLVVKNGGPLEPDVEFTVLEANINFNGNPPLTTDDIWISTFGEPIVIGTPEDRTIVDGSFALASITNDKLTQQAQDVIISNIVTFGI
jgi:hypothetical protein